MTGGVAASRILDGIAKQIQPYLPEQGLVGRHGGKRPDFPFNDTTLGVGREFLAHLLDQRGGITDSTLAASRLAASAKRQEGCRSDWPMYEADFAIFGRRNVRAGFAQRRAIPP